MEKKVWLITGASKGLGRELLLQVLAQGDTVIGTVRTLQDREAIQELGADAYAINLQELDQIDGLMQYVEERYGRLDVLVNNAGYGAFGYVEEFALAEVQQQMEVNFFAVWKLCQLALPIMRKERHGAIIQLSSRLGVVSGAGKGLYSASKFALEGMSEALSQEVAPFGIRVYLLQAGAMRTDFFGKSVQFAEKESIIYRDAVGDLRTDSRAMDGKQAGDPKRVAALILKIVKSDSKAFRIPITAGTLAAYRVKIAEYQELIARFTKAAIDVEFKS